MQGLCDAGPSAANVVLAFLSPSDSYRAKDASNPAVGRNFTLPDGKRLFVGSAGGPDAPPAK